MDIDNCLDTHFLGRKFQPTAFTSKKCTVYPLLEENPYQMNTQIFSAGNEYTLGSRETVILVFG